MKMNCLMRQRGAVVPLVTIVLPILLLAAGWALDFGNVFVNKTRLQNALDAAALSAAITIHRDPNKTRENATINGKATFDRFKAASGNNALAGLSSDDLVFEYSKYLNPFVDGTNPPTFVRVSSTNMLRVRPALIRIFDRFSSDIAVPARATAGAAGRNCNLAPLVICPKEGQPIGCNGTACNGVPFHTKVCLKGGSGAKQDGTCQLPSLPTGEFGLLRFDGFAGGDDIKSLLSGSVNVCAYTAGWETGNKVGSVSDGLDLRFNADMVQTIYPEVEEGVKGYPQYIGDTNVKLAITPTPSGTIYKRIMAVPVVESCDNKKSVNIIATSCFFLTEKATHTGTSNEVIGELSNTCPGAENFDPRFSVLYGPYKIVLFKTVGSDDS